METIQTTEAVTSELWQALAEGRYDAALEMGVARYGESPKDDDLAFALLAARMRSPAMVRIHRGEAVSKPTDEVADLIKNEHLLCRVLRSLSDNLVKGKLCEYLLLVMDSFLQKPKAQVSAWIDENGGMLRGFICRMIPIAIKNGAKRAYYLAKGADLLLCHEVYDEARVLYEYALKHGASTVECRLGILLCALNVRKEEEIATSELFEEKMPEYTALLGALSKHKSKKRHFEGLAEQNAKSRAGLSDAPKKQKAHFRLTRELVCSVVKWGARLFTALFVLFMLAFGGGALFMEIVRSVPFLSGIGEGGWFLEIFSSFILLALVLNTGAALGMTTNLSVALRALAGVICRNDDYDYHFPYSTRRRTFLMSVNLLLCWAVRLFGEQFARHTVMPGGWSFILAFVMGALALAFSFYVFHIIVIRCEQNDVCMDGDSRGSEIGFDLLLSGLFVCLGCAYLFVKTKEGTLTFTGFESFALILSGVIGAAFLLSGIAVKITFYVIDSKKSIYGIWLADEAPFSHVLLSSALVLVVYRSLFYGELLWHWAFVVILGIAALACLLPTLITDSRKNIVCLLPIFVSSVFACVLMAFQRVAVRYDFTSVAGDFLFLLPKSTEALSPEVTFVCTTAVAVFFWSTLIVLMLPRFVGFVWVRILALPLRLLRLKPSISEMVCDAFPRSLPKKLFFAAVLGAVSLGLRHLLCFLPSLLGSDINPELLHILMIAISVLVCYLVAVLFFWFVKKLESVGDTFFERGEKERRWTFGYHISNVSVVTLALGVLNLVQRAQGAASPVPEQIVNCFLIIGSVFVLFIGVMLRISGNNIGDEGILNVERYFGFVYAGLAILVGVVGYLLGASYLIFIPLGALLLNIALGIWISFAYFDNPRSWWN